MKKSIRNWLYVGLFMVFVQIIVGGITRLTGSGLSITKWEIVTGTLPPLNEQGWDEAFDLYKATPQYEKINQGMSMAQFKFIYFWEYIHRLWARLMGLVFVVPFVIFWAKGWIGKRLMRRLITVVLLAAIVASFGWIMVASGLVDRPWVNAYKLTLHLGLGTVLFCYLGYVAFSYASKQHSTRVARVKLNTVLILILLTFIQLLFGGMMSGMKAALFYPTWPSIDGSWIPDVITDISNWQLENMKNYDQSGFAPALIQFIHRMTAYILYVAIMFFGIKNISERYKVGLSILLIILVNIQVVLGILTLINSIGSVPVTLGVMHQAFGVLLLLGLIKYGVSVKKGVSVLG